ncbi:MAG: hypothetical protein RIT45_583 [Pseudomonadota bacterium]
MGLGRRHRRLDVALGALLFCATLLALLATDQMGFARDEAFYFGHAETYQNWQVEVEAGGARREAALARDELLRVWRQNSEHPPLDKVLFGWSWRIFGRKLREIGAPRADAEGGVLVDVRGLGPAHGFAIGRPVELLRPQLVGGAPDVGPRRWLRGTVLSRTPYAATVHLPDATLDAVRARCVGPGHHDPDGALLRTGCEALESRALYVLSESAAMRMPGMLFGALLVLVLWAFARGLLGGEPLLARPFALVAALGTLLIPRVFFHAHLACFDMTITTLLVATTLAYHRALVDRRWLLPTAALWGLSLLAKHNAFVLPAAFIGHWAWDALVEGRIRLQAAPEPEGRLATWLARPLGLAVATALALVGFGALLSPLAGAAAAAVVLAGGPLRLVLPGLPTAWFVMLPVGLAMLVAGWPLLWVDTLNNLLAWLEFHLHHEHYMQTYFGAVLAYPPFPVAMPFVLTLLTWPLTLLITSGAGLLLLGAVGLRRLPTSMRAALGRGGPADVRAPDAHARSLDRLLLVTAIWPIALIAMPNTPVFGGTKHWMTAYPALILLGARALQWAWFGLSRAWLDGIARERAVAAVAAWLLVALTLLPAASATLAHHPQGTMHYNELVGGVPGAARVGLQRQFWGYQARDGLPTINALAPTGARIWMHNSAWGSFMMYQREGWCRRDLRYSGGAAGTALGLFHHQYDHDDYELELFEDYGTVAPVAQTAFEGVPLLSVYERPSNVAQRPSPHAQAAPTPTPGRVELSRPRP